MTRHDETRPTNPDLTPEAIAAAIRTEPVSASARDEAAARAWETISRERALPSSAAVPEHFESCADFQAAIPMLVAGTLPASKAMLVEDHARGCVPCRKALLAARSGAPAIALPAPRAASPRRSPRFAFALAATLTLAAGLGAFWYASRWMTTTGTVAHVESVDGLLLAVGGPSAHPLGKGDAIDAKQAVRTGRTGGALIRLSDGSLVEMRERSELEVVARRAGSTIELARGSVLVQAAKQTGGKHLRVTTRDCVVSVVGTVFSVNAGTKGSRVTVVEGEVRVDDGRAVRALHPGDQAGSNSSVEPVAPALELAWSRNADSWLATLKGLQSLQKEAGRKLQVASRTSSVLVDLAPAGTVFWASVPNISSNLADLWTTLQARVAENPALAAWWNGAGGSPEDQAKVEQALERLRAFGADLGDEIAVAVRSTDDHAGGPLVLAKATDPRDLSARIDEEIARINQESGGVRIVRVTSPAATSADPAHQVLYVWLAGDTFSASPSIDSLRALETVLADPASNPFATSPFHGRVVEAYAGGVGWLAALDLETIMARMAEEATSRGNAGMVEAWRRAGVLDARSLVVTGRSDGDRHQDAAELSFRDTRHGMAAWLAAPAPMGSLDFVSPDASLAASFVVKEPSVLIDDLYSVLEATDPAFWTKLAEFQQKGGIDLRADLAAPLGGEMTFALDGPMLPTPAWKLVVEVYDANRLQQTIESIVARIDEEATKAGHAGFRVDREEVSGRTWYAVRSLATGLAVNYTYVDAWMVMGPDRALVERSLDTRASGATLARSAKFVELLPSDGQVNFSAIGWQNLGGVLAPIAEQLAKSAGAGKLTPKQQADAKEAAAGSPATLAWARGDADRIVFSATGNGGLLGTDLATLFSAAGIAGRHHGAPPAK